MNDSIAERLKKARKDAGFATADDALLRFSSWNGYSYKAHEGGQRVPKDSTLREYAKAFKVRFEWLRLGIGEGKDIHYEQSARAGGMADAPYKGHGSPYHAAAGNMSAVEEAADLLKLIGVASPEAKKTLEGWIKKGVLDEVPIEEVKESGYASPSPKAKKNRK